MKAHERTYATASCMPDASISASERNILAQTWHWNLDMKFVVKIKQPALNFIFNKLCGRPPQYAPCKCDLFNRESGLRVTCDVAYLCANLVFLGYSVLDLGPMYATDRQTTDEHHRLMPPYLDLEAGIINSVSVYKQAVV